MAYTYKRTILASSPAAFWRFNEAAGATSAADSSGNGKTLAKSGNGAGGTFGVTGALAKDADTALECTGDSGWWQSSALAATTTTYTVEFWLKMNGQVASYAALFTQDNFDGIYYQKSTSKISVYFSGSNHLSSVTVANATWTHVAVVVSAGAGTIYLDGVARGTFTGASSWTPNRVAGDTGSEQLKGTIDELAYFPGAALSADTILAHYTAGASGFDPVHEVQMELAGFGAGWTDVTGDLAREVEELDYGIKGIGPTDRLADTGTFKFALDNSASNSGGVVGYYSPGHPSVRTGFKMSIRVRVILNAWGRTFYRHVGRLEEIDPAAGIYGSRITTCTSVDWMDEAARAKVSGLAVQFDQTSGDLFTMLANAVSTPPEAVLIRTAGSDTYPIALDTAEDEKVQVVTELKKILDSELGYGAIIGDETQGGTLMFEGRRGRGLSFENADTFTETDIISLSAGQHRADVINAFQLVTHPREVDASPTSILYDLKSAVPIGPGATVRILGPYRDPDQQAPRIGGTNMQAPSVVSPLADYAFWSNDDGTGTDLTAFLTVTANYGGSGVRYTLTNSATQSGYVTKLQARGQAVRGYQTVVAEAQDATSITDAGMNLVTLDMPYQSTVDVALEAAPYLVGVYKDPGPRPSITFDVPENDGAMLKRLLVLDIGSRIGVSESVTGLTDDGPGTVIIGYFINAVRIQISPTGRYQVTFTLAPADRNNYWLLGVAGRGELDATTLLAMSL